MATSVCIYTYIMSFLKQVLYQALYPISKSNVARYVYIDCFNHGLVFLYSICDPASVLPALRLFSSAATRTGTVLHRVTYICNA